MYFWYLTWEENRNVAAFVNTDIQNTDPEVLRMKLVPLEKQSKKEQKKYHARQRRDWNGLKPTTKVVKSKKIYDRKKLRKPDLE